MEALKRPLGVFVCLCAGSAALVLAPACGNKCNSQAESQQLFWRGKCGDGMPATVMASVDTQCEVTLSGGEGEELPSRGVLDSTGSQPMGALLKDGVNLYEPDGGVVSCTATPADGGLSVACRQPCPGVDAGDNCSLECDGFLFSSAPP